MKHKIPVSDQQVHESQAVIVSSQEHENVPNSMSEGKVSFQLEKYDATEKEESPKCYLLYLRFVAHLE